MGGECHGHLPRPEAASFYRPRETRRHEICLESCNLLQLHEASAKLQSSKACHHSHPCYIIFQTSKSLQSRQIMLANCQPLISFEVYKLPKLLNWFPIYSDCEAFKIDYLKGSIASEFQKLMALFLPSTSQLPRIHTSPATLF